MRQGDGLRDQSVVLVEWGSSLNLATSHAGSLVDFGGGNFAPGSHTGRKTDGFSLRCIFP